MCDAVNLAYLERHRSLLEGAHRVLEVGSYNVNGNSKRFFVDRGAAYTGIDIRSGPDVDRVCDITDHGDRVVAILGEHLFDLAVCMNVLEHLYRPHTALENISRLVRAGGNVVIVVPLVWDLHDWPHDYFRLNPDFFREFARQSGMEIIKGTFEFSIRDTGVFLSDLSELPMLVPHLHGSLVARAVRRFMALFVPECSECWPRIYLNLILRKP